MVILWVSYGKITILTRKQVLFVCMRVLFLHTLKTIYEFDFDIFEGINDLDLDVLEGIDQLDFSAIVLKSIYDADIDILKAIDDFNFDIFEGINNFDFAVERVSLAILGDRTVFGINLDIGGACSKGEKEAEREGEKVLHKAVVLVQETSHKFCAKRVIYLSASRKCNTFGLRLGLCQFPRNYVR